jgi:hypothetical protein
MGNHDPYSDSTLFLRPPSSGAVRSCRLVGEMLPAGPSQDEMVPRSVTQILRNEAVIPELKHCDVVRAGSPCALSASSARISLGLS